MGDCPCPRCLIKKTQIPEVGTKNDDKRRETALRVDTEPQCLKISLARDFIYKKAKGVKSVAVERVLSATSMVPTAVSNLSGGLYSPPGIPPGIPLESRNSAGLIPEFDIPPDCGWNITRMVFYLLCLVSLY